MTSHLLTSGPWQGQLRLIDGLGAAFQPLQHRARGERSLFAEGGLNFEHIFNGAAADHDDAWFTPRTDAHRIDAKGEDIAFVVHDAADSTWGAESRMMYILSEDAIDLQFRVQFHQERFPLGWIGMMWASYMEGAQDRRLHFHGLCDGESGWTCLGEDTDDGFETGTVAAAGVEPLPYEEGAALLNLVEHPRKRFTEPLAYGLLDDGHAWVMMFDHTEAIRLALWNFVEDEAGRPDPTRPAWDWQFVVRAPQLHQWYGYRARVQVVPFTTPGAILDLYRDWSGAG